MGGVKKYFKREFKTDMFFLEHDTAPDFYLSCWQKNRSTIPLLLLRTLIFIGCVSILVTSMVLTTQAYSIGAWFIFLTHWGLILNAAASTFALAVSLRAFFKGPIDSSLELPWYVKAYWVFYNTAIPLAFFITIFYWILLTEFSGDYGINPVLDVFIHLVNSILMLVLVLISRHPTRLLHFYWSLVLGFIYMFFTVIFYFSGATSPFGSHWIYPMVDWDEPGMTIAVIAGSSLGFVILHIVLVGISVGRDKLTQRFRDTNTLAISNDDRYN